MQNEYRKPFLIFIIDNNAMIPFINTVVLLHKRPVCSGSQSLKRCLLDRVSDILVRGSKFCCMILISICVPNTRKNYIWFIFF